MTSRRPPFLRVPPFPGSRPLPADPARATRAQPVDLVSFAAELVRLRVGGMFWGRQPALPRDGALILAPVSRAGARQMGAQAVAAGLAGRALGFGPARWFPPAIRALSGDVDLWHLADGADAVWADRDHDLALVAALRGKPLRIAGAAGGLGDDASGAVVDRDEVLRWVATALSEAGPDPFTGGAWSADAMLRQLGQWRRLLDSNRATKAVFGIARWKRMTLDALLWDGARPVPYARSRRAARSVAPGDTVFAWISRTAPAVIADLAARGVGVGEIEDGMVRSQGLGANCVPPLSVIVDRQGPHFDPSRPNGLEDMLAGMDFPPALIERARVLRATLVSTGLAKYGRSDAAANARPSATPASRHILVPGQVEDDRSVVEGGASVTNLALLQRARSLEPGAHITYRPHPDVEAGHRRGAIDDGVVLGLADAIDRDTPVTSAIAAADALHVLTSLAGFEALMRGKAVTTHGAPFYAGWGLTTDLGPVPARRGRPRTIDDLVAAALILYPRYIDPVTLLPCEIETLVQRLTEGQGAVHSPLIMLRTWQGRLHLLARNFGNRRS